jgi:rubrerythrin
MTMPFSADEIFEMAEQIERNAASFYRQAAQSTDDADLRTKLQGLAAMELEHEKVLVDMRSGLSGGEREKTMPDPWGESILYLRGIAGTRVFDVKRDPAKWLTGKESKAEILKAAIGQEKESIVFYLGMKDLVPENLGKGKIDAIIKEEMKHIAALSSELESTER